MNYNEIKEKLSTGWCLLKFNTVSGEEREYKATLDIDLLPETLFPQIKVNKKINTEVINFFTDKGWRSMKVENFISIKEVE